MKGEPMPVTPEGIRWARTEAGISLSAAKETFPRIGEWEAGTAEPTYRQIETMANRFKVPVAVFFFPDPPLLEPIENSFRTLARESFESIPSIIRLLIRKAKGFQYDLIDLP